MKKLLAAIWILVFLVSPTIAATSDQAEEIAKAQRSAQAWLQLLDAGRYGESWDAASSFWKADHTRERTEQVLEKLRAPLGTVRLRKLLTARFQTVPDGDCVHIVFASEFTGKPHHLETLDMLREKNGDWKVASWSQRARYRDD